MPAREVKNPRLAAIRKAVIIQGIPYFSRRAYGVACIQEGKLIHVESFYGDDGRVLKGSARRYMRGYLNGLSYGLENPLHRFDSLTSVFNTDENAAAIAALTGTKPELIDFETRGKGE